MKNMRLIFIAALLIFTSCASNAGITYNDLDTTNNQGMYAALQRWLNTNNVGGASTPTNSPNINWGSGTLFSFWNTNRSFSVLSVGTPTNVVSWLTITNAAGTNITATLPFSVFSLSAGAAVTTATIPAGAALSLQFFYDGVSTYYVADYGQNNSVLSKLANTGVLTMVTNSAIPPPLSGSGTLVPSNNYDLYWVTPTKTNLVVSGH